MELSELAAYAKEKYHIEEAFRWADNPGMSVLCHPQSGKWIALLMRGWDEESGTQIEKCDIKCGKEVIGCPYQPCLSMPFRMHGDKWLGVTFGARTEPEFVFSLLDRAIELDNEYACTVVLGSELSQEPSGYRETALPFAASAYHPDKAQLPERLRELRRRYLKKYISVANRAKAFYEQAVFMQDYEDDVPWGSKYFNCYYPTYADMTTQQLRAYFTWRKNVRNGIYEEISISAVYVYIYELLNGIGADSPEDVLKKLADFDAGYPHIKYLDWGLHGNLYRWMFEYAIVKGLPLETVQALAKPGMIEQDRAIGALTQPESHTDEAVFSALCVLGGKKTAESPVVKSNAERGMRLFAEAWRKALGYRQGKWNLSELCFGKRMRTEWHPLGNAIYYEPEKPADSVYVVDECRSYEFRSGAGYMDAYDPLLMNKARVAAFLHSADGRFRRYLNAGRSLKEKPEEAWALPYIEKAIEEDILHEREKARQKITIDLGGLDRIRRDADTTRESLMTEEERLAEQSDTFPAAAAASCQNGTDDVEPDAPKAISGTTPEAIPEAAPQSTAAGEPSAAAPKKAAEAVPSVPPQPVGGQPCALPLDDAQAAILRTLLSGEDPAPILRRHHLMPSIAADAINEALFDLFGDTVLVCEEDKLSLVEDYAEELGRYCTNEWVR